MRVLNRVRWGFRQLIGRTDPLILMYHRVADARIDPWNLAVMPALFEEQMAALATSRHVVPLDWLAAEVVAGRRPQGAVAVTFDDAYRDVLENAAPILARHGVPATVFVVSDMIGAKRGFWWDQMAQVVMGAAALPDSLALSFDTPNIARAFARGDRHGLLAAIWSAARVRPFVDRYAAVDEVAAQLRVPVPLTPEAMSKEELHQLTADGLVTLGVHCATHPTLPSLSDADQELEIVRCKQALEEITNAPNRRLAYPFGDYDKRSERIAHDLGFDYAVSVERGPASDPARRFRLPRNQIGNWGERRFRRELRWRG